jgi:TM2 domain-containing membrane protein YozV
VQAREAFSVQSFLLSQHMKSFLAAILSLFVPGLGQLYKGHFVQAIIWFLVVGAAYGLLYWFIFALVPIVLHIICILQAYFMDNE